MRKCPTHFNHGITPNDTTCHSHASETQQQLHNAHCRLLGCPHALARTERYKDVDSFDPRTIIESLLAFLDKPRGYAKTVGMAVKSLLPR
jgi:hypothetical protein